MVVGWSSFFLFIYFFHLNAIAEKASLHLSKIFKRTETLPILLTAVSPGPNFLQGVILLPSSPGNTVET